ncbi:MAG: hypothetical protein WHT08_18500, partial [Bryobacteraceae bacterium]
PDGYRLAGAWRPIPRSAHDDPARAAWLALTPAERAQARLELRRRYWLHRIGILASEIERWERFLREEPRLVWYVRPRIEALEADLELAKRSLAAIP